MNIEKIWENATHIEGSEERFILVETIADEANLDIFSFATEGETPLSFNSLIQRMTNKITAAIFSTNIMSKNKFYYSMTCKEIEDRYFGYDILVYVRLSFTQLQELTQNQKITSLFDLQKAIDD
jgi:hypothetical protein